MADPMHKAAVENLKGKKAKIVKAGLWDDVKDIWNWATKPIGARDEKDKYAGSPYGDSSPSGRMLKQEEAQEAGKFVAPKPAAKPQTQWPSDNEVRANAKKKAAEKAADPNSANWDRMRERYKKKLKR